VVSHVVVPRMRFPCAICGGERLVAVVVCSGGTSTVGSEGDWKRERLGDGQAEAAVG
jgi:hypothetical protein